MSQHQKGGTDHMNKNLIKKRIYQFKHGEKLIFKCVFKNINYSLIFITEKHESDNQIIKLLALWRKHNEQWFPAIFQVTMQGTQQWLLNKVINETDRILFMIKVNKQYIGHIGLYRFNNKEMSCEIDNIVRGVNKYPGIMEHAIRNMMVWGKNELGIKTYTLSTSSDNSRALHLYEKLGFIEFKRLPLVRVINSDRIEWQNAPKTYKGVIKRYCVVMKLQYGKI